MVMRMANPNDKKDCKFYIARNLKNQRAECNALTKLDCVNCRFYKTKLTKETPVDEALNLYSLKKTGHRRVS